MDCRTSTGYTVQMSNLCSSDFDRPQFCVETKTAFEKCSIPIGCFNTALWSVACKQKLVVVAVRNFGVVAGDKFYIRPKHSKFVWELGTIAFVM